MEQPLKSYVLGWLVAMIFLSPLHAQTVASETSAAPADPTSASQAPDDVVITDLVPAGKYAELVPKAHRQQVRRIEVSQIPGSSQS